MSQTMFPLPVCDSFSGFALVVMYVTFVNAIETLAILNVLHTVFRVTN